MVCERYFAHSKTIARRRFDRRVNMTMPPRLPICAHTDRICQKSGTVFRR
jgi:hypothetical protein